MSIFLEPSDVAELTGRRLKLDQIEQLRLMSTPFFVNAAGRPVVTRAAVEGSKDTQDVKPNHAKRSRWGLTTPWPLESGQSWRSMPSQSIRRQLLSDTLMKGI